MSINIGPPATEDLRPKITVVGIGGAGGNAIANMIASEIEGVDFIVANTDAQALSSSPAEKRIQLGPDITGGLGAGARPEVGKAAAEETVADIEAMLDGVNMVFIAAGMGGGTGTGAAPVIAEAARRKGVLTVGVVTKPFLFEGTRRMRAAEAGIVELQNHVDTLIVIPNQNLFLVAKPETTFKEAFQLADEVLQQGVRSITDLIVNPGLINLDFADIRAVMSEMGKAMMGTGEGEGENRALHAAEKAIANPLLDGVSMQGAKGVIISIIGGEDMTLMELDEAANYIRDLVDEDANIIWGSAFNPDLANKIRISVVATGIDANASGDTPPRPATLTETRAPKRPVLELSDEDHSEVDNGGADGGGDMGGDAIKAGGIAATIAPLIDDSVADAMASPEPEPAPEAAPEPAPDSVLEMTLGDTPEAMDADDNAFGEDLGDDLANDGSSGDSLGFGAFGAVDSGADEGEEAEVEEGAIAEPFDLTGMQAGDDMGEMGDDVDEIIDPLAGLRGEQDDDFGVQDDLLADADRLAARNQPVEPGAPGNADAGGAEPEQPASPAPIPSAYTGGAPGGGSTLFERMANLSRSSGLDDEDDDPDGDGDGDGDGSDAPALSIPRFLGRQNNQ